jgi:hypothetical protein
VTGVAVRSSAGGGAVVVLVVCAAAAPALTATATAMHSARTPTRARMVSRR